MSREKIKEMTEILKDYTKKQNIMASVVILEDYAEELYNAGYRKIPENIGEFSDGYHTFNELYHHRAVLFSVICNMMPEKAWKSKLHDTGDMFDGMFIVGIETEQGQATYHYDIEPYWDMFEIKELDIAPKWDGHTPCDAIQRIGNMSTDVVPRSELDKLIYKLECFLCHATGGRLSKHTYDLRTMETVATDCINETYNDGYGAGYRDCAMEIFEEIEKIILDNTYPDFNREHKPVNIWKATTGYDAFYELKKKYTEEKK